MLADVGATIGDPGAFGAQAVLRRARLDVSRRLRRLSRGLTPIVCVGESLEERERGAAFSVVASQVRGAIEGLGTEAWIGLSSPTSRCGRSTWSHRDCPTSPGGPGSHSIDLSNWVERSVGADSHLYGGSVKPDNIAELMREPDVDGALVGGASLDVDGCIDRAFSCINLHRFRADRVRHGGASAMKVELCPARPCHRRVENDVRAHHRGSHARLLRLIGKSSPSARQGS